nr:PREDICTED: uncharacterized protein LOC107397846 isoform X1 [Tribolium castaneum]|eukprot:XP_015835050.1 PREDICTED: uncharacterized protein LOC107397846 isoform X1 [Tribolium castaneum]
MTWFVVHLYVIVSEIRRRFELLNTKFEYIIRTTSSEAAAINCLKCHDLLCGLITKVNKTFGFQIMIVDKLIALRVVETSYLCLLFAIEERTKFSVLTFVNNFIWSIDFIRMNERSLVCVTPPMHYVNFAWLNYENLVDYITGASGGSRVNFNNRKPDVKIG